MTAFDVRLVLSDPTVVITVSDLAEAEFRDPERPNVPVYAGYNVVDAPLVVFVDRFESVAFHSEPGIRRFGWLF